jgi:hypothetical protein
MAIDLEHALFWKERTLQLVLALDKVRDSFDDDENPQSMFDTIVALLQDQFNADACAIALADETSDSIDYVAAVGFAPNEAEPLCVEALNRPGTGQVASDYWPYSLGIQVILKHFPLAGLVLARRSRPFTVEEVGLLSIAESQIDSAVIQARTIGKLLQRNRELEAIYQIDRLRDDISTESDLIAGFTAVLLDRFAADQCIMLLNDERLGEFIVRGLVDDQNLDSFALNAIRATAADIQIPQIIPSPIGFEDGNLLAAPFLVGGERLGAAVVGRKTAFTIADHRLLYAMMSQMDSAIAHIRALEQRREG